MALSRARWVVVAAVLLGVASVSAGCSGDDGSSPSSASALDAAALDAALPRVADLPAGFRIVAADGSQDDEQVGCLAATSALRDVEAAQRTQRSLVDQTAGAVGVFATLASDDDVDRLQEALDDFATELDGCTSVRGTDANGTAVDLGVSPFGDVPDGATDQAGFSALGTLTAADGTEYDYQIASTAVLVGSTLATVSVYQVGQSDTGIVGRLGPLMETVVGRLAGA